jgi:hypothetical protein
MIAFGQRDDRRRSFWRGRCQRADKILDRIEQMAFAGRVGQRTFHGFANHCVRSAGVDYATQPDFDLRLGLK